MSSKRDYRAQFAVSAKNDIHVVQMIVTNLPSNGETTLSEDIAHAFSEIAWTVARLYNGEPLSPMSVYALAEEDGENE